MCTILLSIVIAWFLQHVRARSAEIPAGDNPTLSKSTHSGVSDGPSKTLSVPFLVIRNTIEGNIGGHCQENYQRSIERLLQSTILEYQNKSLYAIRGLSNMLGQAWILEETTWIGNKTVAEAAIGDDVLLSTRIESRIQKMAKGLEHNELVLRQLIGDFPYVLGLPSSSLWSGTEMSDALPCLAFPSLHCNGVSTQQSLSSTDFCLVDSRSRRRNGSSQHSPPPDLETHSYDSAVQIFGHLVRDWTDRGSPIRESLYGWCCRQVEKHVQRRPNGSHILVPGAGMGRLAFDLYMKGHHVEANELSPSMAAAASAVLNGKSSGRIYPYVLDDMMNEVDSERRYDTALFPDVELAIFRGGSLSYTVGDFVGGEVDNYYRDCRKTCFDAVVTCFFIDTAHNIYEYIAMIDNLLNHKMGVWVNVGPVQWHPNAILRPSVDELKTLLQSLGWKLKEWTIDDQALSYRDDFAGDGVRATKYEGYKPLRFVATR